jgi:hypothetical protein
MDKATQLQRLNTAALHSLFCEFALIGLCAAGFIAWSAHDSPRIERLRFAVDTIRKKR